jgi:bifunctional non-homologous end joining protein LigD
MAKQPVALNEYEAKRNFRKTPEPAPARAKSHAQPIFVIQEHHATTLHYDFRLEAAGVLKSWAVTKEPSLDPAVKRLAIHVEDHPLAYATFAGTIPEGHYGAGEVLIWDHGTYEPEGSVETGLHAGRLTFTLHGEKLKGRFTLVRMDRAAGKKDNWLLIKGRDAYAKPSDEVKARTNTPHIAVTVAESTENAPRVIAVTNPDKVLFPDAGITKADVSAYYRKIAPRLLPFLKDRPVTLERLPDGLGAGKPHFWQKNTPASYPEWIPRVGLQTDDGRTVNYTLVNDLPTLLYLVNQGALTFHPWLSRIGNLDRPDFVLFDLDLGKATFADAVTVARKLHDELTAEDHTAVVKTSGKTGLHVLVPWHKPGGFADARGWALDVATRVAKALPETATTEIRKVKRGTRVYIDVLQNARGHHAVPPYVLRAVPGATVSTPLKWSELRADLDPGRFTLRTIPARLARQKRDLMASFLRA